MAFGPMKLLPAYRKLMREGTLVDAVVIDANSAAVQGDYHITLRVHFVEGGSVDVRRTESIPLCSAGDILPVRYDPNDTSHIEIDMHEYEQRRAQRYANIQASSVARAEADLVRKRARQQPHNSPYANQAAEAEAAELQAMRGVDPELAELMELENQRQADEGKAPRYTGAARQIGEAMQRKQRETNEQLDAFLALRKRLEHGELQNADYQRALFQLLLKDYETRMLRLAEQHGRS